MQLMNLPTISEVYRTADNKLLTKTADISQVHPRAIPALLAH